MWYRYMQCFGFHNLQTAHCLEVWRQYVKTSKTLPKHSEDVTRAGSIFAAVDTGTKLTERLKDVDIVAAHKVLGQIHDSHHQGLLQKI